MTSEGPPTIRTLSPVDGLEPGEPTEGGESPLPDGREAAQAPSREQLRPRPDRRYEAAGPDVPRRIVDVVNPPGRTPIDLRRLAPYAASPGAGEEIESMASRLSSWRWGLDTIVSEFARVAATLVVSALVIASVTLGSVWILQRTLPDEIDFGFLEGLLDEDPGGDAEADG